MSTLITVASQLTPPMLVIFGLAISVVADTYIDKKQKKLILAVLILGMAVLILISHDFHLPVEILQTAFPTAEKL